MSLLLAFRGNGTLQADRLIARKLAIESFAADIAWADDRLAVRRVHGRALGGDLGGMANIDLTPSVTTTGSFALTNGDAAASAALVGVPWGQGRGTLNGDFSFEGVEHAQVGDTLRANLHFALQNGSLHRFATHGDLPFRSWAGDAEVASRTLKLTRSTLRSGNDTLALTGTVTSDLRLDLKASSASTVASITGTLAAPAVTTSTTTTYSASNPEDATSAPAKKRD